MIANEDMIKNLEDNVVNLKQSLQHHYDEMNEGMNGGYEKALTHFKQQGSEILKKFPDLKPALLNEAVSFLNGHHKHTLDSNAKQFKTILENIDKKFRVLKDQVTIPQLPVPKLAQPILTKPKETNAVGTSNKK